MRPTAIITTKGNPSPEQVAQIMAMFGADEKVLVLPDGWQYRNMDDGPGPLYTIEETPLPSAVTTILAIGGWIVAAMFAISTLLLLAR